MPKWLHDRARHILAKNKNMPESEAFAIATQQAHASGKSLKSYGTVRGREEAKEKYKTPGDDQKTASKVKLADIHFGRGPHLIAGGLFVSHPEGEYKKAGEELKGMEVRHGSLQKGRAAYEKKYPDHFITAAFKFGDKPVAIPGLYLHAGPTASSAQRGFYDAVLSHKEKAASLVGKLVKRGEFKLQGSMEHQGIPIAIENRKGSVRKGVDKDGKPWRTKMVHPYGYIKGSKGADGEEVDAYVGPHEEATHAYVVHQRKSDGKGYDEDKVMLGFPSKDDAVKGYLKHYNSDKFLGPVKEVPVDRLKEMLMSKKKLVKISGDACADELYKLGAITEEQANSALDRYETLERQKPTPGQVGRYAALGAVAGPGSHIVGNLGRGRGIKGAIDVAKDVSGKALSHGRLRTVAGTAAAGALATGAIPLLRTNLDRNAERKTLRKYIAQRPLEKDSGSSGITPAKPWAANESADLGKYGASATPMGTLSSAKRVGLPRVTNVAGPSIASQVGGHGRVLPGAGKGGIGKGGVSIGSSGSVM